MPSYSFHHAYKLRYKAPTDILYGAHLYFRAWATNQSPISVNTALVFS